VRIRIFDDADRLAEAAAQEIESWVRLKAPDVPIGFAGGSTPESTYRRLRSARIPWGEVQGWMTDERFVPPDDPASNSGMLARTLFDHVPGTLFPVPWIEDPMAAAAEYEQELSRLLDASPAGIKPGLVLLGIGEDGHTASLFPDTEALSVTDRDFVAHWVPQQEAWRLTATMGLLTRARRTMFLISGARKAQIVADVLEGDADHPAAEVSRNSRDAVWLLDRDAAKLLS
jgi:6-phosphogluconolactonase